MANDCLVTKLKASVDNDNLVKIGEMRVSFAAGTTHTTNTHQFKVFGSEAITLTVKNGFIATSVDAASGVTTVTIPAATDPNAVQMYYVSNTDAVITISNKYSIRYFRMGSAGAVDIDDLKYSDELFNLTINDSQKSIGHLSSLSDKTAMVQLYIRNTQITGDLNEIAGLVNMQTMNLSNTVIGGNISNIASLTAATDVQMSYMPKVYGDATSVFTALTSATRITLVHNESVTGNATNYIKKSNQLTYNDVFNFTGVMADLSQLAPEVAYIAATGPVDRTFTWTTSRHSVSGAKAIALQCSASESGVKFGDSLKTMLVDQSQCVFSPQSQASYHKTIDVAGTYDSSDAELATAIATIKAAGWTVKINGATV